MMMSGADMVAIVIAVVMLALLAGAVGFCVGLEAGCRIWRNMLDRANGIKGV